jgi:uncharacterized membrane-anchored protein YhcB (DUF1043 family)
MTVTSIHLRKAMKRFSEYRETVEKLCHESESFSTLIVDYAECAEALQRWTESSLPDANQRQEEYAALLQELKAEITERIKASSR